MNRHVDDSFLDICYEFINLKFKLKDSGKKDSIQIYFPEMLAKYYDYYKQVATIQFMGPSWMRPGYTSIEIRFYLNSFKIANLDQVLEAYSSGRSFKQNGVNPYYHYNINKSKYIKELFTNISKRLINNLGELFNDIETPLMPATIDEIPRY
ncbi:hypothetical protein EHS13_33110 [Paenibacillus psychroresistens]|uniref:Uncharacterized protein n=1 Tax=Paenibacillus psychroresistens TaxID=1778678 RepID=A0A6B8RU04_9BACL|nr:hypothetical protein [Paenibacillus psychroresistens]QGQ99359.1 hypothetical protein EHS13_33110 [Paenibacillus psychroresistens]